MLELTFSEASLLKRLIQALRELLPKAKFDCNEKGVRIMAMDVNRVTLIHVDLPAESFQFYRCDIENTSLGIPLELFHKMLGQVGNNVSVTLRKEDNEEDLSIITDSAGQDTGHREAVLRLEDVSGDEFDIPEQEYTAIFDIPSKTLSEVIKSLSAISDNVSVTVSRKGAVFNAVGDMASLQISFPADEKIYSPGSNCLFHFDDDHALEQEYALRFLSQFSKGCSLTDKATLHLTEGSPLRFRFALENMSFVDYYLAPKITD